jgi:hypothetical protein
MIEKNVLDKPSKSEPASAALVFGMQQNTLFIFNLQTKVTRLDQSSYNPTKAR